MRPVPGVAVLAVMAACYHEPQAGPTGPRVVTTTPGGAVQVEIPGASVEIREAKGTTEDIVMAIRAGQMGSFSRFTVAKIPPAGDLRIAWDDAWGKKSAIRRYREGPVDCVIHAVSEEAVSRGLEVCESESLRSAPASRAREAVRRDLPWLAFDAGLLAHRYMTTARDGYAAALVFGVGARRDRHALFLRGGLVLATLTEPPRAGDGGGAEAGYSQAWAGLAYQHTMSEWVTFAITGFSSRTRYTEGPAATTAVGGGVSLDFCTDVVGPAWVMTLRVNRDAAMTVSTVGLGFVLRR